MRRAPPRMRRTARALALAVAALGCGDSGGTPATPVSAPAPAAVVVAAVGPQYIRQLGQDPPACLGTLAGYGFSFYEILEFAQKKGVFKTTLDSLRARYPESKDDYTNLFLPARADVAKPDEAAP